MDETRVHHYQPEKNNQSSGSTRHRRLQRRHEFPFSPYFPESFALAYSKACQKNNKHARISKLGRNTYKKLYFQKIVGLTMHQRFLYTMLKTFHGALFSLSQALFSLCPFFSFSTLSILSACLTFVVCRVSFSCVIVH